MNDRDDCTLDDLASLDDSALLGWRARARAELERLASRSPERAALERLYDYSTREVDDRARAAWTKTS